MLVVRSLTANPNFYFGSFMIFLCSITYSIYIAGSGKVIPVTGANKFTAYAMLAATTGIFIHFVIKGNIETLKNRKHFMAVWINAGSICDSASLVYAEPRFKKDRL